MPSTPTLNLGLTYPLGSELVSAGPVDYQAIVQILDSNTAAGPVAQRIMTGTLANFTATMQGTPASFPLGTTYICNDVDAGFVRDQTPAWRAIALNFHTVPVGTVHQYAGSSAPADPDGVARWRLCDGGAISRTTYAGLFALIGTTFGAGDGSTTFNVPDTRSRVPVGAGQGSGLSNRALAATGGEETHPLTTAELAAHTHANTVGATATSSTTGVSVNGNVSNVTTQGAATGVTVINTYAAGSTNIVCSTTSSSTVGTWGTNGGPKNAAVTSSGWGGNDLNHGHGIADPTHFHGVTDPGHGHATTDPGHTHTINPSITNVSVGSGTAHNNMQPYLALNHIIKIL